MTHIPIIAGLDWETTGKLEPDHRIIEAYIGLYRGGTKIWSYEQRIDPQRSISADAQRVHGISAGDLIGMPIWDTVAPTINQILNRCDFVVAHNGNGFDKPFAEMEMRRIGLTLTDKPWIDTMLDGVWATADGKKPRLGELAFACGVDYDPSKAHSAAYDVDVMMDCYLKGLDWNFFSMPELEGLKLAA
ncbi:3'-5' exonuclease [Ensifer sp. ENS10]|uniref:3'-5' exonuclease n=1 Tax=Ensifer sp. ENS10 TaxID=2769286 RepID=UPI001AEE24B4|nr:3'-5' exonuclease [Ensifer sp. ENS10]